MSTVSRGVVYSLMAVVVVLLIGITALLGVSSHRHQRLEDTTIDLQRNISHQQGQIKELQQRLEDCDTIQATVPADSGWGVNDRVDSSRIVSQFTSSFSATDWSSASR